MLRKTALFVTALMTVSGISTLSFAEDKKEQAPACQAEIKKFCKKVKPGGGAVEKCLEGHVAEVSPACKTAMDEMAEAREMRMTMKNLRETCKADLTVLCPGIAPGKGHQLRCLKTQSEKLTPTCRAALAAEGMDFQTVQTTPAATTGVPQTPAMEPAPAPAAASATTGTTTAPAAAPVAPTTKQ